MDVATPTGQSDRAIRTRRKLLAVLAAGLVLGVGAAITLAAWNDSEFATGTFGSGAFDLQGSVDGTTFSSSTSAPGKTLSFSANAASLTPGDVTYAAYAVQLSPTSTYKAAVTVAASSGAAIAANLTYSLVSTTTFGCNAAAFAAGTPLVTGAATASSGPTSAFSLAAAGTPTYLCFAVTAGPGLPQGSSGTVTWDFVGGSTTPLP